MNHKCFTQRPPSNTEYFSNNNANNTNNNNNNILQHKTLQMWIFWWRFTCCNILYTTFASPLFYSVFEEEEGATSV